MGGLILCYVLLAKFDEFCGTEGGKAKLCAIKMYPKFVKTSYCVSFHPTVRERTGQMGPRTDGGGGRGEGGGRNLGEQVVVVVVLVYNLYLQF